MKDIAYEGMSTPWGKAQYVYLTIPGQIAFVSTAGHGGIKLSRKMNAQVPDYMRRKGGWYEEDCEWAIPFVVFASQILANTVENSADFSCIMKGEHITTLRNWFPAYYERYFNTTLKEGESLKRDEELARVRHANDLVSVSAVGDWHSAVPRGFVGVTACVGGRNDRGMYNGVLRNFLVPEAEYGKRTSFGFIVDPAKHEEISITRF